VIVNWNHGHLLPGCLDALLAQDYAPLDITVVDNGSGDGSPEWLAQRQAALCLKAFPENRGFSGALNWGVRHTSGDFVLSLNPDTTARQGFVRELVRAAGPAPSGGQRIGAVAPKLLRADNPTLLDSTGLFLDRTRRPFDRGQGEPDKGQYDAKPSAFGPCGAAALYRRAMLEDVAPDGEYFDEAFFAYGEDADLAWRAQSRGWQCVYAPGAVATHIRGWGDTLLKRGHAPKNAIGPRLALRNRYLMIAKNDSLGYFLADLPLIVATELPRIGYAAVQRPGTLLAWLDLLRGLPLALRKRRQIRQRQKVHPAVVRRWFLTSQKGCRVWRANAADSTHLL
jgi:GT2 family glycosyltransferase